MTYGSHLFREAYAYPSSTTAKAFLCSNDGCWFVEKYFPFNDWAPVPVRGPYTNKYDAKGAAITINDPTN